MGKCAFRLLRLTMFVLAAAGLGVSSYLVYLHYGTAESGLGRRLCSGTFDCATVLQSRWGTVPLGAIPIPIALVGAAYFMVLAVWLAAVGRLPGRLHHACLGPALLATLGAADSAYLIHVMGNRLHAWCGFCLAVHGINFLLLAGLWAQWLGGCAPRPQTEQEQGAPPPQAYPQLWKVPVLAMTSALLLGITLLALFGFAGMFMLYQKMAWQVAKVQQDEQYQQWKFTRTAPLPLPLAADDPVSGPAAAPHTVVMFGDFQCPVCAETDKTLKQVQQRLDGSFRVVFKHFPLNHACNAAVDADKAPHAFGCMAAEAAEAARRLGGNDAFWKMHDALYRNQRQLDEKPYARLAREAANLDPDQFQKMLVDPVTRQRVERDAALGRDLGVRDTPAIFLDGRRVTLDVVLNPETQETDLEATVRHWRGLLASAAATQPTTADSRQTAEPLASAVR